MSTVFFTSDMHIGHRKVARDRAERVGVPFPEGDFGDQDCIAWHDDFIAQRWDDVVAPEDIVIVVGDISIGGKAQFAALEWFRRRPGVKHIVTGNHDGAHPSNRDFARWMPHYTEVFASVAPFARRKIAGNDVMISHYPYNGDHTNVDRDVQYRMRDEGMPIIHGHTHSSRQFSHSARRTPQVHIGVDAWDYTPVRVDDVARTFGMI